jgi:hypothetical protein
MRVEEAEDSVYYGLKAMERRPYLAAMWILGGELRAIYADELTGAEVSLVASTLDLVREAVTGEKAAVLADRAGKLYDAWDELRDAMEEDASVGPGRTYAWSTFQGLALEAVRPVARGSEAVEFVTQAVVERWRSADPDQAGPIWISNPDETADDASPLARALRLFDRIVTGVAGAPGDVGDPARLRERILPG